MKGVENDTELCRHMSLAKANIQVAYQSWPEGNLRRMADRIANAQSHLRDAESRLNDILGKAVLKTDDKPRDSA